MSVGGFQERGFRQSFSLFEELAEACRGFDTDFRQLQPAQGLFRIEQLATQRILYTRVGLESHFHQMGASPPGYRTFSLLAPGSTGFRWCGESINSSSIFVMPESGEFESVSPPGLELINLSLSVDLLEQVANEQFHCDLGALLGSGRVLCPHAGEAIIALRDLLDRLSGQIGREAVFPRERYLEERLAYLALACLQNEDVLSPRGPRGKRMKTLAQALSVIDQSGTGSISVEELVFHAGVSRRTLENAFHDGLDISPAAYIKASRLRVLNRDLLLADSARSSVTDLVREHGFIHAGQLAADYRVLFGELPSVTLRR